MSSTRDLIATYTGRGTTSGRQITVEVRYAPPDHGIVFAARRQENGGERTVEIPARADFVVNTLRNVVLGADGVRLCIVEHFLAAAALWGLSDLLVDIDGPELPLADGSAKFWLDLFAESGLKRQLPPETIALREPIICARGEKVVMAIPDEGFSVTYLMDWNHPAIGKRWATFCRDMDPLEIASARTFGWEHEHKLLGIGAEAVSLTKDGFSDELRFVDEPVRHKLLDLVGDLSLSGVNPMAINARFISIKAGHELDVEMARRLSELF